MARRVVVDIADFAVTRDPEEYLITYGLGSCIAVIVHDAQVGAAGMIHYQLPLSTTNPAKAKDKPAMFADTGVPLLFHSMYELGCRKQDLVVKVAGGGQVNDASGVFEIGKRNYVILRKMLWKTNVLISAEDIGGAKARTVSLAVATGRCRVRSADGEEDL